LDKRDDGITHANLHSPLHSSAIWRDPANDEYPASYLNIERYPEAGTRGRKGLAYLWFGTEKYEVSFRDSENLTTKPLGPHGASTPPVVRFAPYVGLEGDVLG